MALTSPKNWFTSKSKGPAEECIACTGEFPSKQLVEAPCDEKHKYCGGCFEQLVKHGCQNESSFPPKCCSAPIPRKLVQAHTSSQTRKSYIIMEAIARIQPGDRWYCPNPSCCKVFDIRRNFSFRSSRGVRCPGCRNFICVLCRQKEHKTALECDNEELRQTLNMGVQRGWRTCPRCKEMVELKEGCRHIHCRCGGQFCYVCGQVWGRCLNAHACAGQLEHIRAMQRNANAAAENTNQNGNNGRPPTPLPQTNTPLDINRPFASRPAVPQNNTPTDINRPFARGPTAPRNYTRLGQGRTAVATRTPAAEIIRNRPDLQDEGMTEEQAMREALRRSAVKSTAGATPAHVQYEMEAFTEAITRSLLDSREEMQRRLDQEFTDGMVAAQRQREQRLKTYGNSNSNPFGELLRRVPAAKAKDN